MCWYDYDYYSKKIIFTEYSIGKMEEEGYNFIISVNI